MSQTLSWLHCHRGRNIGFGVISNKLKIVKAVVVDALGLTVDAKAWTPLGVSRKLSLHLLGMVTVKVAVAHGNDHFARLKAHLLAQHMNQERDRSNIERQA